MSDTFPRQHARTQRLTLGEPRNFTVSPDDSSLNQLARVRWHKQTETKSWLLGCEFVNALPETELETFIVEKMDATKLQ